MRQSVLVRGRAVRVRTNRAMTGATSSTSSRPIIGASRAYPDVVVEIGMVVEDRASHSAATSCAGTSRRSRCASAADTSATSAGSPADSCIDGGRSRSCGRRRRRRRPQRVTASGSVAGRRARPRRAWASRIWVEGIHDAELIEHVWGDDLRELGLVVEPLHGADDLAAAVAEFGPDPRSPARRAARPPRRPDRRRRGSRRRCAIRTC